MEFFGVLLPALLFKKQCYLNITEHTVGWCTLKQPTAVSTHPLAACIPYAVMRRKECDLLNDSWEDAWDSARSGGEERIG